MVGTFTAVITKDLFDGTYEWALNDTITMAVSVIGIVSVLAYGKWNGLRVDDPKMRGYLASCCKAIPQALMAWKILHVGGGGLSPWAIAIAHATTFMRLGQLQISLSEAKQEKNRTAMFIPEISNEITWCFVTAAWLFWKFGG